MRQYAYFDHITRGEVTRRLHTGLISQDEHDAYQFLVNAMSGGFIHDFTDDALAIVDTYLGELRLSGVPRLASHEDKIKAALARARQRPESEGNDVAD